MIPKKKSWNNQQKLEKEIICCLFLDSRSLISYRLTFAVYEMNNMFSSPQISRFPISMALLISTWKRELITTSHCSTALSAFTDNLMFILNIFMITLLFYTVQFRLLREFICKVLDNDLKCNIIYGVYEGKVGVLYHYRVVYL